MKTLIYSVKEIPGKKIASKRQLTHAVIGSGDYDWMVSAGFQNMGAREAYDKVEVLRWCDSYENAMKGINHFKKGYKNLRIVEAISEIK
jgi:hypothetical protein